MSSARQWLFVYGTLRPSAGRALARFLAEQAHLVGPGRMRGRLYDLGRYPGMVEAGAEDEWVHGDVYEPPRPAETLAVLDCYEGCGPEDQPPFLFERRRLPALLTAGEVRPCWVYLYRGPVREEQRILSGDYFRRD